MRSDSARHVEKESSVIRIFATFLRLGCISFGGRKTQVQSAFRGVSAAVVGLLLAALYDPVWTTSIKSTGNMALALVAFGLLMFWKLSPLYVVVIAAIGGAALGVLFG